MRNIILTIIANVVYCIISPFSAHAQNIIDDKDWGYTDGSDFGSPLFPDDTYWVRSSLYSLGPNKYAFTNPKMYMERDSGGYILNIRFIFEEAPWKYNLNIGSTLKLYTVTGDSTVLQKHPLGYFSKFRWLSTPLRGVRWSGSTLVRAYCVDFMYAVNNIDSLLSQNYCGFDVADGFYIQDFRNDPKRIKSFNPDLKSSRHHVDRRAKAAVFKRSALYYPADY